MSKSRFLVLSLSILLLASVAEGAGARRRAVGKPVSGAPVGNQCHTFGFVKPGLKASYRSTAPGGSADYTITWISDTATQTKTSQIVSTPQGNATAVTTIDGEVVGNLRGMKHIDLTTTITVPGLGTLSTEVDIDFVPSLVLGPAAGWCTGHTWNISPVTETITIKAPFQTPTNQVVTTIGGTGEVLAVDEVVTVPAGTFRTVKYRSVAVGSNNTVQPSITWMSKELNIAVKQQAFDATTNALVTDTVLLSVQQ